MRLPLTEFRAPFRYSQPPPRVCVAAGRQWRRRRQRTAAAAAAAVVAAAAPPAAAPGCGTWASGSGVCARVRRPAGALCRPGALVRGAAAVSRRRGSASSVCYSLWGSRRQRPHRRGLTRGKQGPAEVAAHAATFAARGAEWPCRRRVCQRRLVAELSAKWPAAGGGACGATSCACWPSRVRVAQAAAQCRRVRVRGGGHAPASTIPEAEASPHSCSTGAASRGGGAPWAASCRGNLRPEGGHRHVTAALYIHLASFVVIICPNEAKSGCKCAKWACCSHLFKYK